MVGKNWQLVGIMLDARKERSRRKEMPKDICQMLSEEHAPTTFSGSQPPGKASKLSQLGVNLRLAFAVAKETASNVLTLLLPAMASERTNNFWPEKNPRPRFLEAETCGEDKETVRAREVQSSA